MGFSALWIKPRDQYCGNHIIVAREDVAFDYHRYSRLPVLLSHMERKAKRWWRGWQTDHISLPKSVLISEAESKTYDGLWLREPQQFVARRYATREKIP